MAVCVYCDTPLLPGTKPAHVIPSALGGRLKSRTYCCSECNNAISDSEKRLAEALRVFTSMLGVKRGDNRRAPRVHVVDKVQGPLAVRAMIPEPVEQPPTHVVGDGYVEDSSSAPNLPSLARRMTEPSALPTRRTPSIFLIDAPTASVSATAIRQRCAVGESFLNWWTIGGADDARHALGAGWGAGYYRHRATWVGILAD